MGNQTQGDDRKSQQGTQDAGSKPRSDAQQAQGSQNSTSSPKQGQGASGTGKDQGNTIERRADDGGAGRGYSAKEDGVTGKESDEDSEDGTELKQPGQGSTADRSAQKRGNP